MLTYNTHLKPLILPEYGRNIQKMVDYALGIEDRAERTRCAHTIVEAMKKLQPAANANPDEDGDRKFWDHLAIISRFKLDIDWPYPVIQQEAIEKRPEQLEYDGQGINKFQYGRNLINLIDMAASLEPGPDRDALIVLVANQMKKASLAWDDDGYSDERVFADLAHITQGHINIAPGTLQLCEFIDAPKPGKKKKKK